MSSKLEQLFIFEGITPHKARILSELEVAVHTAAIDLFRFLPDINDPRWAIAQAWTRARSLGFKGIHEEASQRAKYLSEAPSFRNGYSAFSSPENYRQICRATVNLNSRLEIERRFAESGLKPKCEETEINLAVTNRITLGTGADGVTGCPEALYQLQLRQRGRYLGRTGFNVHIEGGVRVVSVTNIQGVPEASGVYKSIEEAEGVNPFVFLLLKVKSMFPEAEVRGIRNPERHPDFYNTVLKRAKIKRKHHVGPHS